MLRKASENRVSSAALDGHGLEDRRHVVHQSQCGAYLQALLGIEEWCAWRVVQRPYVLLLNDLILIDEYKVRGFFFFFFFLLFKARGGLDKDLSLA